MPREKDDDQPKVPKLDMVETTFCHCIIQGMTPERAAEQCGLNPEQGAPYMQRQRVYDYLSKYRSAFIEKMAEAEVVGMLRKKLTREVIAERYYALALTPVELTKGTITGQVAALDSLAELLNFKINPDKLPDKLRGMSDEQLREYTEGVKPANPGSKNVW